MSGLPTGWEFSKLDDVATWGSGGTPSRTKPEYFGGDIPWVTISDLTDSLVVDSNESISKTGLENSAAKLAPTGSILIALYGSIGKLGIAAKPLTTNQAIAYAAPDDRSYDSKYLFHYLMRCRQDLILLGTGVTQKNIYIKDLKCFQIPLAPRPEQTRIVTKLEELLTDLDAGVAELKAAQKKLTQYRQSLLKAAVDGSLTAEWRKNNPPTETGAQLLERILKERRVRWEEKQLTKFKEQGKIPTKDWEKKYLEPAQPDISDLPNLPRGWTWATIDQLATIGTGVTPLRSKAQYFSDGKIPWVTSGALNQEMVTTPSELVTELALKECRLELYPVGALLVAMYGEGKTRGKCSELAIPATINQAIAALVLEDTALACKSYLKSFLLKSYEDMRNQASGGVQPNLNLQIIRSIAIPLPPTAEQTVLQEVLIDQLGSISAHLEAIGTALKQAAAQRQNILRAAFAGQLVPQDPNDEPASVLLERIRAERPAQAKLKTRGRKKVAA